MNVMSIYTLLTFWAGGTCLIKPKEDSGVIDKTLSLYGTEKLKIAGISLLSLISDRKHVYMLGGLQKYIFNGSDNWGRGRRDN